jgi:hypothetical protein
MFAVSLVALLLFVSSLAAACDLSCGFALFRSDCHLPGMAAKDSGASDTTMAGMKMTERASENSTDQQMGSSPQQPMSAHAVVADMGVCERQSCDQTQALASKADYFAAAQFDTISRDAEFHSLESLLAAFHESGDDIPLFSPFVDSPLDLSLRI